MFLKTYTTYLQEKNIEDDIDNLGKDIANTSTKETDTKVEEPKEDTTQETPPEEDNTNTEEPPQEDTSTPDMNTDTENNDDATPPEETIDPEEELEINKEILGLFDSFMNIRDKIKNIVANIDQLFFSIEKQETKIDLLKLKEIYNNVDTAIKIIIKKNITKDNLDIVKKQYDDINSITNNLVLELEKIVNTIKTNI